MSDAQSEQGTGRPVYSVLSTGSEESLIVDSRAGVKPSDMVERKLAALLKAGPILASQMGSTRVLIAGGTRPHRK